MRSAAATKSLIAVEHPQKLAKPEVIYYFRSHLILYKPCTM
jgi:hypothetical protein